MFKQSRLTKEEIEYLRCLHTTDRGPIGEAFLRALEKDLGKSKVRLLKHLSERGKVCQEFYQQKKPTKESSAVTVLDAEQNASS